MEGVSPGPAGAMAPALQDKNSVWWYLLHSPDQYMLLMHAPAWLAGSVMAVFSGLLAALGLALLKIAYARQDKVAKDLARELDEQLEDDPNERRVRKLSFASMIEMEKDVHQRLPWCLPWVFWLGLLLYLVAIGLHILALTFAPETTVGPLGSVLVMANVPLAYGLVHERFSHGDLIATAVCALSMSAAVFAMPRDTPGNQFSQEIVKEFIEFSFDMTSNYGFLCYLIVWVVGILICVKGNFVVESKVKRPMRAFTEPILAGLLLAAFSFLVKLFGTLFYHSDQHPEVWNHRSTHIITGAMIAFGLISLVAVCQGIRHFDIRFFVPATFSTTSILMIVQGFLFFKEYEGMDLTSVFCFCIACALTVSSVFFISWERNTVHKPASSAAGLNIGEPNSPIAHVRMPQPTAQETAVLTIMEEHGTRAIEQPNDWRVEGSSARTGYVNHGNGFSNSSSSSGEDESDTDSEFFSHSSNENMAPYADVKAARRWLTRGRCGYIGLALVRLHPIFIFCLIPSVPIMLFKMGYAWQAFTFLTVYWGFYTWKFGLHIALFSNVGRMKVKAYSSVDFEEMFGRLSHYPESPEARAPMRYEEVLHFVILTNYKEDMQILKEAIYSVADCKIARRQISIVLAMEEREQGADMKAKQLIDEMGSLFRHMIYTMHPPGLPGEVPGKSANCRWAAQRLFEDYIPNYGYDMKRVVMTVMDADSEFHPEYFTALNYQFLSAPGDVARYNTIWQAPILHYKNYHNQPSVVRLGSLLTSQHELANLADPSATRMPYSTYSLSGILAQAVDGWDPDWISEDWHMCCKCFVATLGLLKIQPIFLPVMNYTPEADSYIGTLWERWTQAKRHALGISELVYFVTTAPPVVADRHFSLARRLNLATKGFLLWLKMTMVHGSMATSSVIGPINGVVVSYFCRNNLIASVNSFTFLANVIFQILALMTFLSYLYTNIRLYDKVAYRILGHDDPKIRAWFGRTSTHLATLIVGCCPQSPFFFLMGGICEWIAAVKTAATHKFDYVVAAKAVVAPKTVDNS